MEKFICANEECRQDERCTLAFNVTVFDSEDLGCGAGVWVENKPADEPEQPKVGDYYNPVPACGGGNLTWTNTPPGGEVWYLHVECPGCKEKDEKITTLTDELVAHLGDVGQVQNEADQIASMRDQLMADKDTETSKWRAKVLYLEGKTRGQDILAKKLTDLIDEGDAEIGQMNQRLRNQTARERLTSEEIERLKSQIDRLSDALKSERAKNEGIADNVNAIKETLDKLAKKK